LWFGVLFDYERRCSATKYFLLTAHCVWMLLGSKICSEGDGAFPGGMGLLIGACGATARSGAYDHSTVFLPMIGFVFVVTLGLEM